MADVPTSVVNDYIQENAARFGVSPELAQRIFLAENLQKTKDGRYIAPSAVSTDATSEAGARGIMQVMPKTHEGLRSQGYLPKDHSLESGKWQDQVDAGLAALKAKQKEHGTTDSTVLAAAYNGGNAAAKDAKAGNIDRLPAETKEYLQKIETAGNFISSTAPAARSASQADVRKSEQGVTAPSTPPSPLTGGETLQRGIQAYQATVAENAGQVDASMEAVGLTGEGAARAKEAEAAKYAIAGEAAGQVAKIKAVIEAAMEGTKERIATILDVDTRVSNNVLTRNLLRQRDLASQIEPLRSEIDQRMSVGFFDNPLEWMVNATILPGQVSKYNSMTRDYNDSVALVQTTQKMAEEQNKVDAAGVLDLITKRGLAMANLDVAVAQVKAEGAKAEAASFRAQSAMQLARLTGAKADDARQAAQFQVKLGEYLEGKEQKDAVKAEIKAFETGLNVVGARIGNSTFNLQAFNKADKATQDAWSAAVRTGSLGDSFEEATWFIKKQGNLRKMSAEFAKYQYNFQDKIEKKMDELRQTWKVQYGTSPTDKQLWTEAARLLKGEIDTERRTDLSRASESNPYTVSHLNTISPENWKGNPANPIYNMVKRALANGEKINDAVIFDVTKQEVETGKIKPAEAAASLQEYYAQGIARNNRVRDFTTMGMEVESEYKIIPSRAKAPIDLMNATAVEKLFTSIRAARVTEAMFTEVGIGAGIEHIFKENAKIPPKKSELTLTPESAGAK